VFSLEGTSIPPGATSTPRLSFSVDKGYSAKPPAAEILGKLIGFKLTIRELSDKK
jgi:hypothetical protein